MEEAIFSCLPIFSVVPITNLLIGTKGRFWKLGRLIARKTRSTETTGRYSRKQEKMTHILNF